MGGTPAEREVCMLEGQEIYHILQKNGFNVTKIILEDDLKACYREICLAGLDFAFLSVPEDVPVQDVLDMVGVAYNGSARLATALCMDKILTKQLVESYGARTPRYAYYAPGIEVSTFMRATGKLQFPLVLKPANLGTSVGLNFARSIEELEPNLQKTLQYSKQVLAEEFIEGTEITIPMMGEKFFGIVDIHPFGKMYDNRAKMDSLRKQVFPSRLPHGMQENIISQAGTIYEALGCAGLIRIDGIVKEDSFYFLEVNTLPFLVGECAPVQVAQIRYNLSKLQLLEMIILEGMNR